MRFTPFRSYTCRHEQVTTNQEDDGAEFMDTQGRNYKGVLKKEVTCTDAEVRYPVEVVADERYRCFQMECCQRVCLNEAVYAYKKTTIKGI